MRHAVTEKVLKRYEQQQVKWLKRAGVESIDVVLMSRDQLEKLESKQGKRADFEAAIKTKKTNPLPRRAISSTSFRFFGARSLGS